MPRRSPSKPAKPAKPVRTATQARKSKAAAGSAPSLPASHEVFPTRATAEPSLALNLAVEIARLLEDDRCTDVCVLKVAGLSQLSDYLVIASGTSDRQMRSAADDVRQLAARHKFPVFGVNVDDRATWIVVDCVDVVTHVFEPNTRAHYDLEMLWGDASRVDFSRAAPARDRAGVGTRHSAKSGGKGP